jgi:hypothetical protein
MKFPFSEFRGCFTIVATFGVIVLLGTPTVRADTPPPCTATDYKVAAPAVVALLCDEDDVSGVVGAGKLYDWPGALNTPLPVEITVTPYPNAIQWLILELKQTSPSAPPFSLQPGKKYKVVLLLHRVNESVAADATPTAFDLEMNNTVVMSAAMSLSEKGKWEFVSHLAYKSGPDGPCTLQVEDFSGKTESLRAHSCRVRAAIDPKKIASAQDLARATQSPEDLGSFQLILNNGNKATQQLPVGVANLIDIFEKPVKIDSKSQIVPEKAPVSKDASSYYVNLNYAAGKGSKPGWVLDGKIAPVIGKLLYGYQVVPTASADVGQNQVSNLKYTDTIDFGLSFAHMYEPNDVLQGLLLKPGIAYETDREFDRHNLLATPDLQFRFVNLYDPRRRRNAIKFADEAKIAEVRKIPWTRANSKPFLLGYVLDVHTGLELGGALRDTVVKASVGKATLPLPSYHVARFVPQAHGLLEIGRFSIDAVGTARYLTTVENTVLERPDHTLSLKRLHGWNAYGVISGSWNFDPAGHFAFTVAYKDGFSPPKFSRVNTVQSGITIKY